MSNPIKYSDFIEDGAIAKLQGELTTISTATDNLFKAIEKAKKELSKPIKSISNSKDWEKTNKLIKEAETLYKLYNKSNLERVKLIEKISKLQKENTKTTKAETVAEKDLTKAVLDADKIKRSKIATDMAEARQAKQAIKIKEDEEKAARKLLGATKDEAIVNDILAGTLEKLAARNRILTKERKLLHLETDSGRASLARINAELDKNNKAIKDNSDALGKQRLNIGNYKEDIKAALQESGLFSQAQNELNQIITISNGIYGGLIKVQEKVVSAFTFSKQATIANTIAEEENIIATEAAIIVEEANVVALEATTVATETATVATGGFGKALNAIKTNPVLIAIGLLVAAAVAIVAQFKAVFDVSQDLQNTLERSEAVAKSFAIGGRDAAKSMGAFKDALFASRVELRELEKQLQAVSLDEQDFIEISNDVTIGFAERNVAQKEAIRLSEIRAAKALEIVDVELKVIEKEIKANKDIAHNEQILDALRDKLEAKQRERVDAADVADDLQRQNSEKRRQLIIAETIAEVDLLLKKKQSANSEKVILENKLADENNQLNERKRFAKELLDVNKKTVAEEIAIIKRKTGIEFDEAALIGEQDAILLKAKLDGIKQEIAANVAKGFVEKGIGEELKVEIAKIVKQAQENEIENAQILAKLKEEEIARDQRILQIKRKISSANLQDEVSDLEIALAKKEIEIEKSNAIIFDGTAENIDEIKAKRDADVEGQIKLIAEIGRKKENQLRQSAIDETINSENSIKDKKEEAATILAIENQLDIDIKNLDAETAAKEQAARDKKLEEEKKLNKKIIDDKKKLQDDFDNFVKDVEAKEAKAAKDLAAKKRAERFEQQQQFIDIVSDAEARSAKLKDDAFDKDIERKQKNLDRQQELADKGANNNIVEARKQLEQAELARADAAKKEVRRQQFLGFLKTFNAYVEQNPDTALQKSIATIGAVALAGTLFAATGAEDIDGAGTKTSDSIPAMLSRGESVLTADATAANKGLATALNKGEEMKWFAKNMLPKMLIDSTLINGSTANNINDSIALMEMVGLKEEIKTLQKIVANKREMSFDVNKLNEWVTTEFENGIKTVTTYKNKMPRL